MAIFNSKLQQSEPEGHYQWVDLRENLQETIDFPMKYGIFLYFFPENQSIDTRNGLNIFHPQEFAAFFIQQTWRLVYPGAH